MRFAPLLIAAITGLCGQGLPDAAAVLDRSLHALDGNRSYRYQSTMSVQIGAGGRATVTSATISGDVGKVHIEAEVHSARLTAIDDGRDAWIYRAADNVYWKQPSGLGAPALLELIGIWSGTPSGPFVKAPRTVREESILANGEMRDCWVVEWSSWQVHLPAGMRYDLDGVTSTMWFDKQLGLAWRNSVTGSINGSLSTIITMDLSGLTLNPPLPDSLFVFAAPAGARGVRNLWTEGVR